MENITKTEAVIGFGGLDVANIRSHFDQISSDWNGKDIRYISGGDVYSEEHAHLAREIADKARELELMLFDFAEL